MFDSIIYQLCIPCTSSNPESLYNIIQKANEFDNLTFDEKVHLGAQIAYWRKKLLTPYKTDLIAEKCNRFDIIVDYLDYLDITINELTLENLLKLEHFLSNLQYNETKEFNYDELACCVGTFYLAAEAYTNKKNITCTQSNIKLN